jgi:hypothetical protein
MNNLSNKKINTPTSKNAWRFFIVPALPVRLLKGAVHNWWGRAFYF